MILLCLIQLFGSRRTEQSGPKCWLGLKVFGSELSVLTCDDLHNQMSQLSLSAAGLAVRLLKVNRRQIVLAVTVCLAPHVLTHVPVFSSRLFVLQGQEVQLNHRAVLMTEQLVLPSLSGLPVRLGVNMTSILSLRLKGNINYRDTSHFSLTGYIKPKYSHITAPNSHDYEVLSHIFVQTELFICSYSGIHCWYYVRFMYF